MNLFKSTFTAMTRAIVPVLLVATTGVVNPAFGQTAVLDPSLEVFRIRCQIDADVDPATGLIAPKVQIQVKARADLLDGHEVSLRV